MLKAGTRLRSVTSEAEVVVVKGSDRGELSCAGHTMLPPGADVPADVRADDDGGRLQVGKRYVEPESGVEALCVRAGVGTLRFDGRALAVKDSKTLPASD